MFSTPRNIENSTTSTVKHLVIVAGGKGTRLASVASDLPKALMPVGGKPVLQHQLEMAAAAGIHEVTIFAGYLANKIAAFVGDGRRFGLRARIFAEKEPLGNAGALLQSLDSLPDKFLVLYGDVMHAINLQRIAKYHIGRGADFTALAHPNDHPYDSDLLETDVDGWVRAIHLCPHPPDQFFGNLVNAAIYVVRREVLRPWAAVPGKQDFVKTIILGLVAKGGRVLAYRSSEYAKDMGTPDRLQRVEADWQAGKISLDESERPCPMIFLDRDGTLNVEKGYLRNHQDLELIAGVGQALRRLRQAGYRLAVLTNQPVIARGEASDADVAVIHRRLEWELGKARAYLDGIYICPHHPDGGFTGERKELKIRCNCRKPNTGLFERACADLPIDVTRSWMVGDQTVDIEMARRAGLRSILLRTGAGGQDGRFNVHADYVADDLMAAAEMILREKEGVAL